MKNADQAPTDPAIQKALEIFMQKNGLTMAQVGRIIDYDSSPISFVNRGIRPNIVVLSRLYTLTEDEAFKPMSEREIDIHEQENRAPPESLTAYLEKQEIPEVKPRKKTAAKSKRRSKPKPKSKAPDPEVQKAMIRFLSHSGLKNIDVARIVDCDKAIISKVKYGKRPSAVILAKLYLLTGDEAFQPQSQHEEVVLETMKNNLPKALEAYLENNPTHQLKGSKAEPPSEVRPQVDHTPSANRPKTSEKEAIVSPHFDRILSGVCEIEGQTRFVVTADTFQPLTGEVTNAEINDTLLLLQELRRRFAFFAQLTTPEMREVINQKLEEEVNELYVTLELCKEKLPFKAAALIDDLRDYIRDMKF